MQMIFRKLNSFIDKYWNLYKIWFPCLLIVFIFFPIRHTFFTSSAYITGQYSDFTSFSIYIIDILSILYIIIAYIKEENKNNTQIKVIVIIIIIAFFANLSHNIKLQIYTTIRTLEVLFLAHTLSNNINQKGIHKFYTTIIACSLIQSILAIAQFSKQHSFGLNLLGETTLNANTYGVAKILLDNITYIRAYGSLPHPNILGFLLASALTICFYFIVTKNKQSLHYLLWYSILTAGFILTFSRSALLVLIVSHGTIILFSIIKKQLHLKYTVAIILLLVTGLGLTSNFWLVRSNTQDQSFTERFSLNQTSIKIITQYPIFGAGTGQSLLIIPQIEMKKIQPWEYQPIHNYYLLTLSELGIIGGVLIIFFLLKSYCIKVKQSFYDSHETSGYSIITVAIFGGIIIAALFDHYFYTIPETQNFFWFIFALLISKNTKIKTPKGL